MKTAIQVLRILAVYSPCTDYFRRYRYR